MTNIKRIKFFIKGLNSIFNQKLRNKSFQYYSDQYWNDLPKIQNYINQSATDNPDLTWIKDILIRFKQYVPFNRVLIVGCGNGWVERELYDLGIGKNFDAFDMSDSHLQLAKKLAIPIANPHTMWPKICSNDMPLTSSGFPTMNLSGRINPSIENKNAIQPYAIDLFMIKNDSTINYLFRLFSYT